MSCPQLQLSSYDNYCTTISTSMIQCLRATIVKHKTSLTFILHTHNYYPKMILFLMLNKPPLTNKTIIHHNILLHPRHNNHKHKYQTKMNISSQMKISLYNFTKKTHIFNKRVYQIMFNYHHRNIRM